MFVVTGDQSTRNFLRGKNISCHRPLDVAFYLALLKCVNVITVYLHTIFRLGIINQKLRFYNLMNYSQIFISSKDTRKCTSPHSWVNCFLHFRITSAIMHHLL